MEDKKIRKKFLGFTNFLLGAESSIFDPAHHSTCHDMDHPFSHYFIATSHNTYLVEDQIKGPSSVDGYIAALKRCSRFIECKDCKHRRR